jgi:hypothetical protein
LHQKKGSLKQILQPEGREINSKRFFLNEENVKKKEIQADLLHVLRPDTGFWAQVPP